MGDSNRFFEIIAQEAIMGIIAFGEEMKECLYINRLARELLEVPMQDETPPLREGDSLIPLRADELFPTVDERAGLARPFSEDMLSREGLSQDVLLRKKNGHPMIANVGIKHVKFDDGIRAFLVMFQDITIQKKLQREVQSKQEEIHKAFNEILEQNKQLKELDHAKDKFIALTTHELRTPLAAIVATADVLELGLHESDTQRDELIHTIHEQGLHLMELINDILDFAKIRAGKMDYYVERVELAPLIAKLAANFDPMAAQARVTVEMRETPVPVSAAPGAGQRWGAIHAYADVLRLKEIVNNVINNSIKYNRPGGRVTISIEEREGFARIIVSDTGPGIAPDKIKHVFNEFETVGNLARHHKGTGLGMPISKRLAQAMGGDLTLESEEGVGTSFFIDVPTQKVLAEECYRSRPDVGDDLAA